MELKSANALEIKSRKKVFSDRERTNILRKGEQRLILFLLKKVPPFITPNWMTFIGMIGSVIVFSSFILAIFFGRFYLGLGLFGLAINWLGDSLDGRLAYYREIPRKWYGFALDIMMDWMSIILIGIGYYYYEFGALKVLGFLFVVFYGWSMIISLLRYKISGIYKIDSGSLGPTELRVIIALFLLTEVIIPGSISYLAAAITFLLFVINILESIKILRLGDSKDREEKINV
jgi:phosphatidylglycerophosphate synthase